MGSASPTPGYQHSDSRSQLLKFLQVQQNYLPGAAALGFLPFPIPTQLNTAGCIKKTLFTSTEVHASCYQTSNDYISASWTMNSGMFMAPEKNIGGGCLGHQAVCVWVSLSVPKLTPLDARG